MDAIRTSHRCARLSWASYDHPHCQHFPPDQSRLHGCMIETYNRHQVLITDTTDNPKPLPPLAPVKLRIQHLLDVAAWAQQLDRDPALPLLLLLTGLIPHELVCKLIVTSSIFALTISTFFRTIPVYIDATFSTGAQLSGNMLNKK